jgi:hypothetical protein
MGEKIVPSARSREMRRTTLLVTAVAVAILLTGGVALAKNISCARQDGNVCAGTNQADNITGTNKADIIKARGGADTVMARGGRDRVFGQDGSDILLGGTGNDRLNGGPNPITAFEFLEGGPGDDTLVESPGIDRYGFETNWGDDQITGNGDPLPAHDDDDLCFSCSSNVVTASVTVNLATGTATDGTNTVTWDASVPFIEGATGGLGADNITGSAISNNVNGSSGADTINVYGDGGGDGVNCGFGDGDTDTATIDSGDFIVPNSCNGDTIITVP